MNSRGLQGILALLVLMAANTPATAQTQGRPSPGSPPVASQPAVAVPDDYVIGPEDVIGVMFWKEPEMNGDVTVRPDGIITLPLLGDIKAVGLKPEALRDQIQKAAARLLTEPSVTVVVRQINSRKAFITGQVAHPGAFSLVGPRTVLQLIALAGGLNEYADGDNITIMRTEQARTRTFKFNYKNVSRGKALEQNIQLQPGDTVVVP
jgi:polysaccharide biosynthesis/export protein